MSKPDLSTEIARTLREDIVAGRLVADDRLPSETDLAEQYGASRATIREALKRLAAQNLIRTQRGAFGGAFVARLDWAEAQAQHATMSTLLISMNEVDFATACHARFALERACAATACQNREAAHLDRMRAELSIQARPGLSDEAFCASDVTFHRAFVDATANPILSYQLAGAIEALQPLMNMITYTARSRDEILRIHGDLLHAVEARDAAAAEAALTRLETYTTGVGEGLILSRHAARSGQSA